MPEKLTVALTLDDREYVGKLEAAGAKTVAFGDKVKKTSQDGHDGFNKLTQGAETLKGKMSSLGTVLLGAGFAEMARRALSLSDNIADLAQGSDISIGSILALRAAFEANGGSADGLGKIIQRLNAYLYDAREGSAQAQESLLKLGLSFSDMANLDTEQALTKTIQKLSEMKDATERNALAARVFGKEAKNINWEGIAAGSTTATEEQARYAESIKKAAEAHDKLIAASEKLTIAFVGLLEKSGILKFINNLSNDMATFEKIVTSAGIAFSLYFGAVILTTMAEAWVILGKGVTVAAESFLALDAAVGAGLISKIGKVAGALGLLFYSSDLNSGEKEMLDKIHNFEDEISKLPESARKAYESLNAIEKQRVYQAVSNGKSITDALKVNVPETKALKAPVTPAWQKEVDALDEISNIYAKTNKDILDKLKFEGESVGLTSDQLKKKQQLFDMDKAYNKQLDDINSKLRQEGPGGQSAAGDARIAQLKIEKEQVTANYSSERDEVAKTMDLNAVASRKFSQGWDDAWGKYKDSATNAAENARTIFNKITGSMEDMLVGFFKTGKMGWKEFANTVIEEMLRIQLRQTIANIMPNFGSSAAGSSGGGNIFSGIGKLFGFAEGGIIPTNGPVLVGEKGPEILSGVGGRSVTPNNQLGGNTVVNYNISAVDAMSFKAMIARDPSFIHAVAMKGARTMPGGA